MHDLRLAIRALRATPVVSAGRGPVAGARHRRQHRHLLARQQPAPARVAGRRAAAARRHLGQPCHQRRIHRRLDLRHLGSDPPARAAVRRLVRVVDGAVQPRAGRRRNTAGRRHLRQRRLLLHARRAGAPRPHLHARRRCARRREGWTGGRHQLRAVAAALRRLGHDRRHTARRRARAVHDHRRHAAVVLRRRSRPRRPTSRCR